MLVLLRITLRSLFYAVKNYGRYPKWIGMATRRTIASDLLQHAIEEVGQSNNPWLEDHPEFLEGFKKCAGDASDYLCEAETML